MARKTVLNGDVEIENNDFYDDMEPKREDDNIAWHVEKVRANEVWNLNGNSGYTGNNVIVAILDTGVNYNHVTLSGKMWNYIPTAPGAADDTIPYHGWDFGDNDNNPIDEYGHGSHVAGIVAGSESDASQIIHATGIAPDVKIMAIKVYRFNEHGNMVMDDEAFVSSVQFAIEKGADIINYSNGEKGIGGQSYKRLSMENALDAGIVATVSAGNEGLDVDNVYYAPPYNISSPGNCPPPWSHPDQILKGGASAVICVGATNKNDSLAYYSSIGPVTWAAGPYIGSYNDYPYVGGGWNNNMIGLIRPDVVAPGGENGSNGNMDLDEIQSLRHDNNNGYCYKQGTSMAAPCVAGVIALMLDANPNLTPERIDEILETTAVPCNGQTGKNNKYGAGRVDAVRAVEKVLGRVHVYTSVLPANGGFVEGVCSYYLEGDQCTLTATPNLGFAFAGWYNGAILVSMSPSYTFTVNGDRTLTAMFAQRDYTITVDASPMVGGTVSGGGTYPAGSTVTVSAHANSGYQFNGWMENGEVVAISNFYMFAANGNRTLTASFVSTEFTIGSLVTNPDGSQGVVFYLEPSGTKGWMVALNDASEGCAWGETSNVLSLLDVPYNTIVALGDLSGYRNTGNLRAMQGEQSGYAAAQVDYANGWYLPSSGQLRKLYSALPFIESAIEAAGGTTLTEDTYWSSTEYSASNALSPSFAMNNTNKASTCRVRAIRNFVTAGNNVVLATSNDNSMGTASVSGNGIFANGATVTVTATPNTGFAFNHWSEGDMVVSYEAEYQFTFTRSRSLVAHFSVPGSVGSIVNNPDGYQGVVFWRSPDGDEGLMVALEDASEGCQWGEATDALTLLNKPYNSPRALQDVSGNTNTRCIRKHQGVENDYAASLVDFEDGWYLPAAGELFRLYDALPLIETALVNAGGSLLPDNAYWSSTEHSGSEAVTINSCNVGCTNKTNTCRVREIRHFATAGPNSVLAKPNDVAKGTTTGSGEYTSGQTVTVTALPNSGYVFNTWTENGMIVSYNATYQFTFTRSRSLVANFVIPGSIGSIVTNSDGSRGVVFYTDPSGFGGWMVALEDDSEGCAWGNSGEDVLVMDNVNPSQTIELLSDLDGKRNSRVLRGWFTGQSDYAANQVDYNNQWFLPSAGQLRKLYAALPMIEPTIVNAGGMLLTDNAYWSSTEQSADNAWTPSFAFGSTNKGSNCRVRAIRSFVTPAAANSHIFVGTNGTLWSDPSNWMNPSRNLQNNDDDVIVTTQCVVDENATVKSLTMAYGSTISVDAGKTLAATERISNTYDTRINLGLEAQLVNPTEGTYFSMDKEIAGYGSSEDGGWYTIATPLKDGMSVTPWIIGNYDLYYYEEPTHFWRNQKMAEHNFTRMENGQGYLYANAVDQTLNFTGQAKSSTVEYTKPVTNSASAGQVRGFNLLGNPFTSNLEISNLRNNGTALSAYYKVSNGNTLVAYTDADDEPIRPMEGFFVQGDAGTVSFNTPSRDNAANGYIRLVLYEGETMLDRAYLKTSEGVGLSKLRMDGAKAELYFRDNDNDFAITKSQEGVVEYPLYFKTKHDGSFSIASDLLNAKGDYLHLIDNLTGNDIDLLATPSYTFEAKAMDYASRFRLVFSICGDANGDNAPFAYVSNGEIVIVVDAFNASLQVIDMMGRVVQTVRLSHCGSRTIAGMPAGVYVLRLIDGDKVRTQKIVIP